MKKTSCPYGIGLRFLNELLSCTPQPRGEINPGLSVMFLGFGALVVNPLGLLFPSRLLKNPVVSCSDSSSEEIWKNKDESRGPYAKSTERQNSPVKVSNKGLK